VIAGNTGFVVIRNGKLEQHTTQGVHDLLMHLQVPRDLVEREHVQAAVHTQHHPVDRFLEPRTRAAQEKETAET
jgi:hypothetical protein